MWKNKKNKKRKYYAIAYGGGEWIGKIVTTWEECQSLVNGVSGICHKSFSSEAAAERFLEEQNIAFCESKNKENSKNILNEVIKQHEYDLPEVELTESQSKALSLLLEGGNFFISGNAGTGKSFLLKKYITEVEKLGKNVLVCAPTGIAAVNIMGITLHSAFKAPANVIDKEYPVKADLSSIDIVVIDEISMCRIDLFDYVIKTLIKAEEKSKKKIHVVLFGDFFQLSPVVQTDDKKLLKEQYFGEYQNGFAFESKKWNEAKFKTILLTEIKRQGNPLLIEALNQIRVGDLQGVSYFNDNCSKTDIDGAISLFSWNNKVKEKNESELKNIKSDEYIYHGNTTGEVSYDNWKCIADSELHLKPGCRVMMLHNDLKQQYFNGSMGTVIKCNYNPDSVEVELDNGNKVVVNNYEWKVYGTKEEEINGVKKLRQVTIGSYLQIPLKVGYACTVHKSQGQTFDKVNVNPGNFAPGQLYVALSRIREVEGLYLTREITDTDLKTDPEVINFYKDTISNTVL